MVRVALLPPRYGHDVLGGAELGARLVAENMVAAGHEVEIFTTCAREITDWADEFEPGTSEVNGVRIHRFRSESGRAPDFDEWGLPIMADPARQPRRVADEWIRRQGPLNPDMVEAAVESDADAIIGYPYLYWPAVELVRRAPDRAILQPAAHDEPPLRLPVFGDALRGCRGIVWGTEGERLLVESVHRVGHQPGVTIGLGVTEGKGSAAASRTATGLGDRPFLLCLGRIEPGKGVTALVEMFAAYKARRPGPLALAVVGPVKEAPPSHPDVVLVGPVDEDVKWGLLDAASILVSPSGYESFSFVVLEAFLARTPVLVNGRCAATTEHAHRSGAAIPFDSYGRFEGAVDRLLADPDLAAEMGERGRRYATENFTWPQVISRYIGLIERVIG